MSRLQGKVAIITGAASGIGRGCAEAFLREGARVVLADLDPITGEATMEELSSLGGQAVFMGVDVAEPASVQALIQGSIEKFGGLDILVNNAGIGGRRLGDGPVHECSLEAWDRIMQVNLRGAFLTCKYAIPELIRRGGGSIVTISSVLGLVGTQGLFDTHAYAASKAGLIGLTRAVAVHYASQRVRANVIAPGLVDTQMAARTKADPSLSEQVAFWQPLKPLGEVQDVAGAAVFLASDESKFITGAVLPVDGGWTAQ